MEGGWAMKRILMTIFSIFMIFILNGCAQSLDKKDVCLINEKILFALNKEGATSYYQICPDGSNMQKMEALSEIFLANDFSGIIPSPDNTKIAFSANYDNNFDIFVFDVERDSVTNVTNSEGYEYSFGWSPDGNSLAFVSDKEAVAINEEMGSWTNDLYIVNLENDFIQKLSDGNTQSQYGRPSWSPDGNSIVYSITTRGKKGPLVSNIGLINLNSFESSLLTDISDLGRHRPVWSPDGKKIMYLENGLHSLILFVMNNDGTDRIQLTDDNFGFIYQSYWSPDGTKILLSVKKDDKYYIYTVNADGTDLKNLSTIENQIDTYPYWSPNGKSIVFVSKVLGENNQLFIMDSDGSSRIALTDAIYESDMPIWISTSR